MANKTATLKNQAGDNIYPNIVGDNRSAAIKDSATIKHTLADNKISLDLDETVKGKIDAALLKPATAPTKTELVGVGAQGQENIEIGDNLKLANGKLDAVSAVSIIELTAAQLNTVQQDRTITFTTEQANIIKKDNSGIVLVQFQGITFYRFTVSKITQEDNSVAYTLRAWESNENDNYTIAYILTISDFTQPVQLSIQFLPRKWLSSVKIADNNLKFSVSDDDYFTDLYVDKINNIPIRHSSFDAIKNYSFTEDKAIPFLGNHSVLVPKTSTDTSILPCTTDDNGKILSVVEGQAQWATPAASGPATTITFED